MTRPSGRRAAQLVPALALAAGPLLAAGGGAPGAAVEPPLPPSTSGAETRAPGPAGDHRPADREDLRRRSAELVRGYYFALIGGDARRAAGFLHPDFIARLRAAWLAEVEAATAAQQRAKLAQMGLQDLAAARLLEPTAFFVAFFQSPAGAGLRALSDPALIEVRPAIEHQRCRPDAGGACIVTVRIKGARPDGTPISAVQTVYTHRHEGRDYVDDRPPAAG